MDLADALSSHENEASSNNFIYQISKKSSAAWAQLDRSLLIVDGFIVVQKVALRIKRHKLISNSVAIGVQDILSHDSGGGSSRPISLMSSSKLIKKDLVYWQRKCGVDELPSTSGKQTV